jgi:hypothetical protein
MVEFKPGISPAEVVEFKGWLETLAVRSKNLVRMVCGEHRPSSGEALLNPNAPNVVFAHFVSVWEFADERSLDEFVLAPFHREMAGNHFRRLVQRRYVINLNDGEPKK